MIFPTFSKLATGLLVLGAVFTTNAASIPVNNNDNRATDALSIVSGLKSTTGSLLSSANSQAAAPGGITQAGGSDILSQLTKAISSATSSAQSLPAGSVPASSTSESGATGTKVATLVSEILRDVVAIVAHLGALPLLGPLLLAVDALLVGLLTALAPVVGGLLANVAALLLSLGGQNLAQLVANLGAGLTAGLLTLAV